MQRDRRRSVAAAAAFVVGLTPSVVWAYHAGDTFEKPPGAGGAGSVYYAGVELEHGWDCTLCHENPPRTVDLGVTIDPPLAPGGSYAPGQVYSFEVQLLNEHAGLNSALYNFNSIVVEVVDRQGFQSGKFDGFSSTDFVQPYNATLLYGRPPSPNVTSWSFRWTAPDAGAGPVSIHLAALDGDGASTSTDSTATTDPYGDDFVTKVYRLTEGGALAQRTPARRETAAFAAGLLVLVLLRKRTVGALTGSSQV